MEQSIRRLITITIFSEVKEESISSDREILVPGPAWNHMLLPWPLPAILPNLHQGGRGLEMSERTSTSRSVFPTAMVGSRTSCGTAGVSVHLHSLLDLANLGPGRSRFEVSLTFPRTFL